MSDNEFDNLVKEIYGCEENPISYMIEPRGSVEITDKNTEPKKEDFENIL